MPQMNKDGKFVFGESEVHSDGRVQLPPQAVDEYRIASEGKVYLFTGSKITGGFCVTRQGLLLPSKLGHNLPTLLGEKIGADLAGKDEQHSETFVVAAVYERPLFIMTDKGTSA